MVITYFTLLIFEGVFRKWAKIGSIDIFYILRDALLFIEIIRIRLLKTKTNSIFIPIFHLYFLLIFGIAGLQNFLLNINTTVSILGIRNYIAPALFAYYIVIAEKESTVILLLRRTMLPVTFVETILVILQVISPRNGFVNATPTGSDAIVTSGLQVRPLGTFTSSLGLVYFLIFSFSFCLYLLEQKSNVKAYFLVSMVILITLLSGSRTAPVSILFISFIFLMRRFHGRENTSYSFFGIPIILSIATALVLALFPKVWEAYLFRLKNQTEGSIGTTNRVLESFSLFSTSKLSLLGDGIGMHHASAIPFYGVQTWVESENLRWSWELGLTGYLLFYARVAVAIILLAIVICTRINKPNYPFIVGFLPMLLVGGISTQPTIQGIASLSLATILSVNIDKQRADNG